MYTKCGQAFLTVADLARHAQVSAKTVHRDIQRGELIPPYKIVFPSGKSYYLFTGVEKLWYDLWRNPIPAQVAEAFFAKLESMRATNTVVLRAEDPKLCDKLRGGRV